jgi:uncharacterized protein YqjF (DUF2071 family)
MSRPFLTAEWRKLIMAQYQVSPETLLPHLPPGLELDLYRDPASPGAPPQCFVSLVGFLFDRVRVLGISIPRHTRFPEINLRFYVARTEPDGTRKRGVVFLSEIVPRRAISAVARGLYEEPYATHPMRFRISLAPEALGVSYQFDYRKVSQTVAVSASPSPRPIAPGSVEEFITEHYFGYTRRHRGATSEYGVVHPRWSIYAIDRHYIRVDFASIYGPAFAHLSPATPDNILLAEGSAVSVLRGTRLTPNRP